MNKEEYREYLLSEHWQKKRLQKNHNNKSRCNICLSDKNINVHHMNYRNLHNEDSNKDLLVLCRKCHYLTHQLLKDDKIKIKPWHRKAIRKKTIKAFKKYFKVKTVQELIGIWN